MRRATRLREGAGREWKSVGTFYVGGIGLGKNWEFSGLRMVDFVWYYLKGKFGKIYSFEKVFF